MTEEEAEDLIDLMNMHEDPDELTEDEFAEIRKSRASGDSRDWDDLKLELGL